jgi:hypothetical protein
MNRVLKLIVAMVAVAGCAAGLAACSSGSKSAAAATSSATGSAPAPSGSAGAGRRGAFADPKVTACLKGAGITLPNRVRPSGSRSAFPSGSARPSGPRPSGSRASGFPRGGGFGGFGNSAQAKKIQVALKACGITLPTGGNRVRPSGSGATPSASPTS